MLCNKIFTGLDRCDEILNEDFWICYGGIPGTWLESLLEVTVHGRKLAVADVTIIDECKYPTEALFYGFHF